MLIVDEHDPIPTFVSVAINLSPIDQSGSIIPDKSASANTSKFRESV